MNKEDRKFWYQFIAWTCVAMMIIGLLSEGVRHRPKRAEAAVEMTLPPLELSPMPLLIETVTTEAVIAHMTAVRVDPPEPPAPTAAEVCNTLEYDFEEMINPMICFRAVAAEQGVSPENIQAAEPWIFDVIVKESGGCPFLIGGDRDIPVGCTPKIRGTGSDTGFGQATHSYWGSGGKLCTIYGVCSPLQILESPYHSMLYSVVYVAMLDGRYGYCDYRGAPRWHNCGLVSRDWRLG